MESKLTARERIKKAFITMLETSADVSGDPALLARIGSALDEHFTRYCSFYDADRAAEVFAHVQNFKLDLLLRPADCDRIPVSAITSFAGVNRTTFYKYYPHVAALYEDCCEDLVRLFLAVEIPREKTPETMFAYGEQLRRLTEEKRNEVFTLSHRVDRKARPYEIAQRVTQNLRDSLTAPERASGRVRENLDVFREMFASGFGLSMIESLLPDLYPDVNLPVYRPEISLLCNIAQLFSDRCGGDPDFYLALGGAALKLLCEKSLRDISVSELCRTAGYPRGSFYRFFEDRADYVMKVCENSTLVCVSAFLYFLDEPGALTPEALDVFRSELAAFEIGGLRAIFRNGSITYVFSILNAYLIRIYESRVRARTGSFDERMRSVVAYYVAYAIRLFSMYLIGDLSRSEFDRKCRELPRIRRMIGL